MSTAQGTNDGREHTAVAPSADDGGRGTWATRAAARAAGDKKSEPVIPDIDQRRVSRRLQRRLRLFPDSGRLIVITGILHCVVGLCIPQFQVCRLRSHVGCVVCFT